MRGIALGAMAGAAALVAAAPADARETHVQGSLWATGGIAVSWHGDPARGCAAAGLCGYSGSVSVHPADGQYDFTLSRGRLTDSYSFLDLLFTSPVVRVTRAGSGSEDGACVDLPTAFSVDLTAARAGRGRLRVGLEVPGLSPARCAGPELSKALARLPRHTVSLSRLTRGSPRLDFSGAASYVAGRFSGRVRSNLRVRFTRPSPDTTVRTTVGPPPDRRPLVRVVHLHARYRVSRLAGSLSTSFGGLTEAPCADFDACGVSGSSTWAVASSGGVFALDAYALARRSDHGVRGALAAIRRGPAVVFGEADLSRRFGTTTADVNRPGGTPCHDTSSASSPGVVAGNGPARRLTFELGGEDTFPSNVDLLRTGCPGPRDEDVLGLRNPAAGSVPLGAVGQSSIDVQMRGSGRFGAHGYSGTRSADIALGLRRLSLRAVYRRARGIE